VGLEVIETRLDPPGPRQHRTEVQVSAEVRCAPWPASANPSLEETLVKMFVKLLLPCCAALLTACAAPPPAPAPAPPTVQASPPPRLLIEQLERGVQIVLPSVVLFAVGKADLGSPEAGPYLERVAQLLSTKTNKPISVEGHTDADGAAALNDALSKARAKTVADALGARGVAPGRLSTAGYSYNRPAASNATDEGKRLNRRVEVIVLDEKVENITAGEPAGSFESAWARVKDLIDRGLVKPAGAGS
jgi:outer membrane protein OmpA-like peptidoglycan-associated protein